MKKLLLSLTAAALFLTARADEGMWIPMLIGKNYDEMLRLGLTLSKEDIYSINRSSLKDAIVQFGGGCTAEMISAKGLLLTNHHCGYESIASVSSVEKNYLDNGFWSKSMDQEIPCAGLSVIFLQRMEDVTDEVREAVGKATGEEATKKLDAIRKEIEDRAAQKGKYVANVKEYFNGNQYLLLIYKRYTDVRLVATPPKSLGKFGGDTDNWMWPRHTADFSMFRVYADANNEPAAFSLANVPYQPKKFLPVSIGGVEEGDYAMIMGYPGRTNRYEIAAGVDLALKEVNPFIVSIRDKRLAIMRKHMDANKGVYLKLTSSYQRIANYWKYFIGQSEQLKRNHVVDKKQQQEAAFTEWASAEAPKYASLIAEYSEAYRGYAPYAKHNTFMSENFRGVTLNRLAAALEPLAKALQRGEKSKDTMDKYLKPLESGRKTIMKEFDEPTDKDLFAAMTEMYFNQVPKGQHPPIYQEAILKKYGSPNSEKTWAAYADYVYKNTFLLDDKKWEAFVKDPNLKALANDPATQHAFSFVRSFEQNYQPKVDAFNNKKREYSKKYIKGLMKMMPDKKFYPDANSTMRLTYGRVLSYQPQDGVKYKYYTTLDGLVRKYKPGDDEFDAPQELLKLNARKDYGRYADDNGELVTCFITNNDITGGNSGSPVINGNGELIGLAFDGNWEAMSGDIAFDKRYKRTICMDSRFLLFLIDKLGQAPNIIAEMDVRD